ncbi:MAG TPA: hypothetical protein VIY72_07370 [Acidimicrobiales bacterium]
MHETLTSTDRSAIDPLVDLVAAAHESGALMLSAARLIDALLDARAGAAEPVVVAVDRSLVALGHRSVVTIDEALEMVAEVTAADQAATTS